MLLSLTNFQNISEGLFDITSWENDVSGQVFFKKKFYNLELSH